MRTIVKCLNCEIKWVRVIVYGSETELTDDLMYNCPNCNSNYFEVAEEVSLDLPY